MARSARRVPTVQELDERLTTVERELAQVVSALTISNDTARREIQTFRETFMEHRAEVRQSFAAVIDHTNQRFDAVHELITRLHAEAMVELGKLQRPD
jgi:DNA anti-recombination protein RmuC